MQALLEHQQKQLASASDFFRGASPVGVGFGGVVAPGKRRNYTSRQAALVLVLCIASGAFISLFVLPEIGESAIGEKDPRWLEQQQQQQQHLLQQKGGSKSSKSTHYNNSHHDGEEKRTAAPAPPLYRKKMDPSPMSKNASLRR